MSHWLTIEVFDGAFPASQWRSAHGESLLEAAITNGVSDWVWHEHRWGVVLELAFGDDERRDQFRSLPTVQAALDAVPDPVSGLLVYPGRGGGSGALVPRRPGPAPSAAAAARDDVAPERLADLTSTERRWRDHEGVGDYVRQHIDSLRAALVHSE